MRHEVYRKLQREIDKMPIPFSETSSGAELKLLEDLFTPFEAEIASNLNILPESISVIRKRLLKNGIRIAPKELEAVLDGLVQKGAIAGGTMFASRRKGKQYSLIQLALGMFELQINHLSSSFVEHFEQYTREQFHKDVFSAGTKQMRTIPIGKSITPEMHVEAYDDIRRYVRSVKDEISVADCVCRQAVEIAGGAPRRPDLRETCLMFGNIARFYIESGYARSISREEAIVILERAEEAGFILQPGNSRRPKFICCCCPDCCHALKMMKMHPKPSDVCVSSYQAAVDPSKCKGCRKCMEACGMEAISMKGKLAVVDYDRCIGCGICASRCKHGANRLQKKTKPGMPPVTTDIMYAKIMIERFGFIAALKTFSQAVIGKKA